MNRLILWTDGQFKVKRDQDSGKKRAAVCLGIALVGSDVPTELVGRYNLRRHLHLRGGQRPEFRFFYRERRPRLPILRDGQLLFARWGNGRGQSRGLPRTGWTWLSTVHEGWWQGTRAVPVDIPASYGLDGRGVWYKINLGIRGLLVPDERGIAVVYMICEPSSHYYQIMTGASRMPVFIDQRI